MTPPSKQSVANSSVDSRVSLVEASMDALRTDVAGLKTDLRAIATSVTTGFQEIRRDVGQGRQTNWGWIAAFIGVCLGLVGYVTSSLIAPLNTFDDALQSQTDRVQEMAMRGQDLSIRADERLKMLERWQDEQIRLLVRQQAQRTTGPLVP